MGVPSLDKPGHLPNLPRQPMEQNKVLLCPKLKAIWVKSLEYPPNNLPVVSIDLVVAAECPGHLLECEVCSEFHWLVFSEKVNELEHLDFNVLFLIMPWK